MRRIPRNRRDQRGQAIAELMLALIGIVAVFVGVVFMLAVGQANIETLLAARGEADLLARMASNDPCSRYVGAPLTRWEAGGDGLMFTNDDQPTLFFGDNGSLFKEELGNDDSSFNLAVHPSSEYVLNNFARGLAATDNQLIFVAAANMVRSHVQMDFGSFMPIEDLRGTFRALIYRGEINVANTVYMPAFGDRQE